MNNMDAVVQWYENEMSRGRLIGGQILVHKAGRPVLERVFGRLGQSGAEVQQDTNYWIASMTKPVTCATALSVMEEGYFSLTTPVHEILPVFANVKTVDGREVGDRLKILDLMRHTSGIIYGQFGKGPVYDAYRKEGIYNYGATNDRMAKRLAQLPLQNFPGTVFEYGMSIDLLGYILEVVKGQSLGEIVQERITGPLRMTKTCFQPDRARTADPADLAALKELGPSGTGHVNWESGGGGLWSTARDYSRFALMLRGLGEYDGTRVLSTESVQSMLSYHLPAGVSFAPNTTPLLGAIGPGEATGLGFGLGLAVRVRDIVDPPGFHGEYFWPGISGGNFWVDPKNDLVVVFLTHAPELRKEHRASLRKAIYNNKAAS